jgi:hypothetical protein
MNKIDSNVLLKRSVFLRDGFSEIILSIIELLNYTEYEVIQLHYALDLTDVGGYTRETH